MDSLWLVGSYTDTGDRIRRIKCDEGKPACLKCTSTGRKCDGYQPGPKSTKRGSPLRSETVSPAQSLTILPSQNPLEIQALQFFQLYTKFQISGYFESELWNCYVLRLGLVEPSVFHATTALGSLHRWHISGNTPSSREAKAFALQQYNKAISCLIRPEKPLSRLGTLVTCYMFSGLDALYGNYRSAFQHAASGISLLSRKFPVDMEAQQAMISDCGMPSEEKTIEDQLVYHFSRLDILASTFDSTWVCRTIDQNLVQIRRFPLRNLEEANMLLGALTSRIMRFKRLEIECLEDTTKAAGMLPPMRDELQREVEDFSSVFEELLQASRKLNPQQVSCSKVLKVQLYVGRIMIFFPEGTAETYYDEFLPLFESIVSEASHLVSLEPLGHFSNDMGFLPALYLTGVKCRDSIIRNQALALLKSTNRKEGVWESWKLANIVERLIAIEEAGRHGMDLAESARVSDISVCVGDDEDDHALVNCTRRKWDGNEVEQIEERIDW